MRLSALGVWLLVALLVCGCATQPTTPPTHAHAAPDLAEQREAMRRLSFLLGEWTGETRMTQPDGAVRVSRSEDDIELLNAGTVLTIRGRSYAPGAPEGAAPVGENFGILSYDDAADRYELRVFAQGGFQNGEVPSVEDGAAQWLLAGAGGVVRFDVRSDGADAWIEEIELSRDEGRTWAPLMHIRFTRRSPP